MGQYYLIVNLDKREFLHPHKCGDGLKLLEFACSSTGTLTALAILLADGNNRGGGDLRSDHPIIGSWAGDRIVIAGDYADEGRFTGEPTLNLYALASERYLDISQAALRAMADDCYMAEDMKKARCWQGDHSQSVYDFAMSAATPEVGSLGSDLRRRGRVDEPRTDGACATARPYSVLLLYPDYLDDTGYETYYAFVEAGDALDAVAIARREAAAAQTEAIDDPTDFHPLLVTEGHQRGEPLFNK